MQNARREVRLQFGSICDSLRLGDSECRERGLLLKVKFGG